MYIAEAVDPEVAGRAGINGSPVPEANPEYDLAELAIAPIFMNQVFTNQFVPDVTNLGHGTYFGPKKGLNGKWAWYNIQTEKNPDMKVGNFKGEFEIVPKPELCAIYASSFIYRRCVEPLPSLCPAENPRINPMAKASTTVSSADGVAKDAVTGVVTATLILADSLLGASAGEQLKIVTTGGEPATTYLADVFVSFTGTKKQVQLTDASGGTIASINGLADALAGATVTVA